MKTEILSKWIAQLDTPELYRKFDTDAESKKAEQVVHLSRILNRTEKQNLTLYENLDLMVTKAKSGSVPAKTVIIYAFYPLLIKYVNKYYRRYCRNFQERISLEDVVQNSFEKLLYVIDTYDSDIASFTYSTNILLKKYIQRHVLRELEHIKKTPIRITGKNTKDFLFNQKDSIFNYLISEELLQQIQDKITTYSNRARSNTARTVCNEFFSKKISCREIATKCGVSYHAVYEIVTRIKRIIANILEHNQNCGYKATLITSETWTLKKKNRDYLNTYIQKAWCRDCGHCWSYKNGNFNKCSVCRSTNWAVKKEYVKLF